MKNIQKVQITVAAKEHLKYSGQICQIIEESAKVRGTGIAKRETSYIE